MLRIDNGYFTSVRILTAFLAVSVSPVFATGNAFLTLVKKVNSTHGGNASATSWTLVARRSGPVEEQGAGGFARWVFPTTYTLSEVGSVPGYTNGTSYDCTGTLATGAPVNWPGVTSITLNVGDNITCTITNSDTAPRLALVKKVLGPSGNTASPSLWTLAASGPTPLSGAGGVASSPVEPGVYKLSEYGSVFGYTNGTSYDCVGTLVNGAPLKLTGVTSITLSMGDVASCTITNAANPTSVVDLPFQVRYASNLQGGDSIVNLTNTGANGNNLFGPGYGDPTGNICVNIYAFSPDEQMISCCSCLVTPNGLQHVTANSDLVNNTLTGIRPNSIVIKLVATATGSKSGTPTYDGSSCTNSAAQIGTSAFPVAEAGLLAWGTTLHSDSGAEQPAGPLGVTETPFLPATLSRNDNGTSEIESLRNRCTNIIGNGSSFGICRSCRLGGLGGSKQ